MAEVEQRPVAPCGWWTSGPRFRPGMMRALVTEAKKGCRWKPLWVKEVPWIAQELRRLDG